MVKSNIDTFIDVEKIKTSLIELANEVKETNKIFKSIQTSLDLIYNDRDLIKDVYAQGESIKGLILALDKHNETLTKSVEQKVDETKHKVETTGNEVKDTVEFHSDNIADSIDQKDKKKGLFK